MKKLRLYIDIPFLDRNRRFESLPLTAGIIFSWVKYNFEWCKTEYTFPRKHREGSHLFAVTFGVMYFSVKIGLYKLANSCSDNQ